MGANSSSEFTDKRTISDTHKDVVLLIDLLTLALKENLRLLYGSHVYAVCHTGLWYDTFVMALTVLLLLCYRYLSV